MSILQISASVVMLLFLCVVMRETYFDCRKAVRIPTPLNIGDALAAVVIAICVALVTGAVIVNPISTCD